MVLNKLRLTNKRGFLFLLSIGILIWAFKLFQAYLIFDGYNNPPPLIPYPSFFEYCAYSLVAFTFPFSWKLYPNTSKRIIAIILVAIGFSVCYIFVLNFLEWTFRYNDFNLWGGFIFSLYHSILIILLTYGVISFLLFVLGNFQESSSGKVDYIERLSYKSKNQTFIVDVNDVAYFESNDNYVSIHFKEGKYELLRKPLSELETELDPKNFQRIHRKFIVNRHEISSIKVNESGGTEVEISNGQVLSVSKTYRSKLRASI